MPPKFIDELRKNEQIGELARLICSIDMPAENGWCVARAHQYEARILAKAIIENGYSKESDK